MNEHHAEYQIESILSAFAAHWPGWSEILTERDPALADQEETVYFAAQYHGNYWLMRADEE